MKPIKILICLMLAVILVNCEIRMRTVGAQEPLSAPEGNNNLEIYYRSIHGMEYGIVINTMDGGVTMVNVTKDSFELEYLKQKLKSK